MEEVETRQDQYASFLVRLWRSGEPVLAEPGNDWRGEIDHIQSGRHWKADNLEAVLATLRQLVTGLGCARPALATHDLSPDEDEPLVRSERVDDSGNCFHVPTISSYGGSYEKTSLG